MLKTHEEKSKFGAVAAGVGFAGALFGVGLLARNFQADNFVTPFRNVMYAALLGGAFLIGLAGGVTGFFIGVGTAGQKRNEAKRLSWIGLFGGAIATAIALCGLILFYFTKQQFK